MFADPQTITVNAIAKSLVRTGTGVDTGGFATSDRAFRLSVSHDYKRRTRRLVKMTHDSLVASPLISGQNINQSVAVHLVVDSPAGYDVTLLKQDVDGFVAWLAATSGANVTKLLGGES